MTQQQTNQHRTDLPYTTQVLHTEIVYGYIAFFKGKPFAQCHIYLPMAFMTFYILYTFIFMSQKLQREQTRQTVLQKRPTLLLGRDRH